MSWITDIIAERNDTIDTGPIRVEHIDGAKGSILGIDAYNDAIVFVHFDDGISMWLEEDYLSIIGWDEGSDKD